MRAFTIVPVGASGEDAAPGISKHITRESLLQTVRKTKTNQKTLCEWWSCSNSLLMGEVRGARPGWLKLTGRLQPPRKTPSTTVESGKASQHEQHVLEADWSTAAGGHIRAHSPNLDDCKGKKKHRSCAEVGRWSGWIWASAASMHVPRMPCVNSQVFSLTLNQDLNATTNLSRAAEHVHPFTAPI